MAIELGTVTIEEADRIRILFRRKRALEELLLTIDFEERSDLYERIIQDLVQTNDQFADWWHEIATNYNWEYSSTNKWSIDFGTRIVTLE